MDKNPYAEVITADDIADSFRYTREGTFRWGVSYGVVGEGTVRIIGTSYEEMKLKEAESRSQDQIKYNSKIGMQLFEEQYQRSQTDLLKSALEELGKVLGVNNES